MVQPAPRKYNPPEEAYTERAKLGNSDERLVWASSIDSIINTHRLQHLVCGANTKRDCSQSSRSWSQRCADRLLSVRHYEGTRKGRAGRDPPSPNSEHLVLNICGSQQLGLGTTHFGSWVLKLLKYPRQERLVLLYCDFLPIYSLSSQVRL